MGKKIAFSLLVVFLLFPLVSSDFGYDNPNLPEILLPINDTFIYDNPNLPKLLPSDSNIFGYDNPNLPKGVTSND